MFGDDPDPLVMAKWFRFETTFRRVRGFDKRPRRQGGFMGSEETENKAVRLIWEEINTDKEEAATTSGCKFYENMRMQCS